MPGRAVATRIVERLRAGAQPVHVLVEQLGISQPAVSKHLRILREAGLVQARATEGQRRLYELRPEPFMDLAEWLEPYRQMWRASLDRLEQHLDDSRPTRQHPLESDDMNRPTEATKPSSSAPGERPILRFERHLAKPVDAVWRAVTDPEEMRAWFPTADRDRRVEGRCADHARVRGADIDPLPGTVCVEWDPPRASCSRGAPTHRVRARRPRRRRHRLRADRGARSSIAAASRGLGDVSRTAVEHSR